MLKFSEQYKEVTLPALRKEFSYKNVMAVPRIEKIVVNTGFGRQVAGKSADEQNKIFEEILSSLSLICGQRASLTRAKKSIAGFKLREGSPIGAKVTLRGKRMEDFFDRLVHVVLPRSRDFRGIDKKSFDKQGSATIGIPEHVFFPEISPEKVKVNFGLEITIRTTAKTQKEGVSLLKLLGFPLQ